MEKSVVMRGFCNIWWIRHDFSAWLKSYFTLEIASMLVCGWVHVKWYANNDILKCVVLENLNWSSLLTSAASRWARNISYLSVNPWTHENDCFWIIYVIDLYAVYTQKYIIRRLRNVILIYVELKIFCLSRILAEFDCTMWFLSLICATTSMI